MVICMVFKTVRGMRDFLPDKARKKRFIEETCKRIFELYGFEPLETPIVEELKLLTKKGSAGAEIEQELYTFEDKAKRKLGLRFDLTVPLARVVANNKELRIPFKRYQIGRVYRYDRPQAKRYREFTQADVDIIGVANVLAELELIALSYDVVQALGIDAYMVINSRMLLESLALASNVQREQLTDCFRAIDKAEKFGWPAVEKELGEKGISAELLDIVKKNDLNAAEEKIKEKRLNTKGLEEIKELMGYIKAQQLSEFVRIDLALARGLDYYTGIVMEVRASKGPSIGGGGRYDKLIGLYGSRDLPATGISFGVDRILDTIEGRLVCRTATKVFVIPIGKERLMQALELTQNIRKLGINAELDLMQRSISKNLEYVNKKGIPYAIILGEKELQRKSLKLRNMDTGEEQLISLNELKRLKEIL